MKIPAGELLFVEGDAGECMYIILSGKIRLMKREGDLMVTLGELGTGSILGEMSLLDKQPRSATAKTLEDTEVAVIDQVTLELTLSALPNWFVSLVRILTQRLRETTARKHSNDVAKALPALLLCIQAYWEEQLQLSMFNAEEPDNEKNPSIQTDNFKVFVPLKYLASHLLSLYGMGLADTALLCRLVSKLGMGDWQSSTPGQEGLSLSSISLLKLVQECLLSKLRNSNEPGYALEETEISVLQNLLACAGDGNAKVFVPIKSFLQSWKNITNTDLPVPVLQKLLCTPWLQTHPPLQNQSFSLEQMETLVGNPQEIKALLQLQGILPLLATNSLEKLISRV